MEMDNSFWLGVIRGSITTLLAGGIVFLGRGVLGKLISLIPGLESTSIRGTWETTWWEDDEEHKEHSEVVKLKQFLHYVWGTVEYKRIDDKVCIYKLRGIIKHSFFAATYEIKHDPAASDLGSFTVKITDGLGTTMKGKYSWPHDSSFAPISGDYEWEKRED
jgi:hypothetical protein